MFVPRPYPRPVRSDATDAADPPGGCPCCTAPERALLEHQVYTRIRTSWISKWSKRTEVGRRRACVGTCSRESSRIRSGVAHRHQSGDVGTQGIKPLQPKRGVPCLQRCLSLDQARLHAGRERHVGVEALVQLVLELRDVSIEPGRRTRPGKARIPCGAEWCAVGSFPVGHRVAPLSCSARSD